MEAILMKIYEFYTGEDRDLLLRAYDFAKEAHNNQKRASGEPYFIHPCAVAEILVGLGLDPETAATALYFLFIPSLRAFCDFAGYTCTPYC